MKLRERTLMRMLPGILLVAILISIILGNGVITHRITEEQGRNFLEQATGRKAEELEKAFFREQKNMETIAHMTAHIMEYEFIDTQRLVHLTETTSYDGIEYIHVSGGCYGTNGQKWNVQDLAYFKDAMNGNSGYAFDDAEERGEGSVLLFYAPIKTDEGDFDGILCGYMKEEVIAAMLDTSFWGQSAREYLCTGDGTIIARSDGGGEETNISEVFENNKSLDAEDAREMEEVFLNGDGSFSYKVGGTSELVDVCSFSEHDFIVVDTFPSEVMDQMSSTAHTNTLHATLTVCAALLLYVLNLLVQNARNKKKLESENKKITALLEDSIGEAEHDGLTNLLNRRGLSNAVRIGIHEDTELALVLLDIDHFKEINDTYGHEIGDRILLKTANVLKENFGSDALICRMGGDEFILILRDQTIRDSAQIKAQFEKVNEELKKGEEGLPSVSLSVGVAFSRPEEGEKIFGRCDEALYEAKRRGRSCVCVYEEWIQS